MWTPAGRRERLIDVFACSVIEYILHQSTCVCPEKPGQTCAPQGPQGFLGNPRKPYIFINFLVLF